MARNPRILLYAALILAVLSLIQKTDASPQLPLVRADYQRCAMIHNVP